MEAPESTSLRSTSTAELPAELNLLTLNCWGLLHISKLRAERLREIGRQIALLKPAPDIVCLQECWVKDDFRAVHGATAHLLPHAKFYHSGAFGGGLVVMSRWPIEASSMIGYPLNGRPTAFFRGDWYVGKGIAHARIRIGPGKTDVVEVFNTHVSSQIETSSTPSHQSLGRLSLPHDKGFMAQFTNFPEQTHAPYSGDKGDTYTCHRLAQIWELSKHLHAASSRGHLALALGDFNTTPLSLAHRLLTARAPVVDVWRVLHPDSSLGHAHQEEERARNRPPPTAQFNIRENGTTSDTVYCTWRWSKRDQKKLLGGEIMPVRPDAEDLRGKRLDYIFAGAGDLSSGRAWVVKSASVEMRDRHPDLHVSLSDHFAVYATLAVHPVPRTRPSSQVASSPPVDPSPSHPFADYDTQLRRFQAEPESVPVEMYSDLLDRIKRYTRREKKQRYWRGMHFYVSVLVWLACLVAVWFSPYNFVAFILMLLASLGLVAGVIDGLLALLFFSGEIRALKEFKWEVRNAQTIAKNASREPQTITKS